MKLKREVNRIEVYYDGRCGMCCTFHEWVNAQERSFGVNFIPYQSDRAEEVFPGVGTLDPAREMIVRSDDGKIFRGAEAWVWCLFSCRKYQAVAVRLAQPGMLGVAVRACRILAANRHCLSKVFFRKKDREVRETLHEMSVQECGDNHCDVERDEWRQELIH